MSNAQSVDQNYWARVTLYFDSVYEAGNICGRLFQSVSDEYESLHWWNFIKQNRLLWAMMVLNDAELYLLKRLAEEAYEDLH